jgi:hypothetical protein
MHETALLVGNGAPEVISVASSVGVETGHRWTPLDSEVTSDEERIEALMVAAELSGRTTVADALARELERARARRLTGATSNVVELRRR